ncbi:metallophosphoesterase 1-like [Amphiura filiformis]|uniref:metallophosphoesterase 1-like n=1 Tax=Amphiura filiformis TaxID=82378 RepID=UPI003B2267C6
MRPLHPLLKVALFVAFLFLLCELFIYYLVIIQCSWPTIKSDNNDALRAFFISDTHLLGSRQGHWFDKLRREWQMTRAFQSAMTILNPDAVFVLGDLTDEGKWASDYEFDATVRRFWTMFYHNSDVDFNVVAGNHDIGFHDVIEPNRQHRFEVKFKTPSVQVLTIKDNVFVLVNSITMETDMCSMCSTATEQLRRASMQLNCTKYGSTNGQISDSKSSKECDSIQKLPKVAPILLQHYPLWRVSDAMCTGVDAAPPNERYEKFRPGYGALPLDASQRLLSWIQPRLVISGHTHYNCYVVHDGDVPEISVPSFSWRNLNNPSIVLATISKDKYEIGKCFLPQESTVKMIYIIGVLTLAIWFLLNVKKLKKSLVGKS